MSKSLIESIEGLNVNCKSNMCRTGSMKRTNSTTSMALSGKSFHNQALASDFNPNKALKTKKKESNAFGLRTNRFCEELHDIPGPGKYYRPMSLVSNGIAVSRSQRFSNETQIERLESFRPGPGSYTPLLDGSFSSKHSTIHSTERKRPTSSMKKRDILGRSDSPGPGYYYPYGLEERKAWDKSFSYSFKSTGRRSDVYARNKKMEENVAPGSYNVGQATEALDNYGFNVGQTGAAFRSKVDRWKDSRPQSAPAPGQYDVKFSLYDPRPLSVFSSSLDRFGISPYRAGHEDSNI